jgi:hypothetical protein
MKVAFIEMESAYDFVNSAGYGEHAAVLDKATGNIYCHSESGGIDEIPEELWESDDAIEIPHKKDLGLGNSLVFDFVRSRLPDDVATVREIFSKRGAYARYKDLVESRGLLQEWYEYDQQANAEAIRSWCKDNGIELQG